MTKRKKNHPSTPNGASAQVTFPWWDHAIFGALCLVPVLRLLIWKHYPIKHPISKVFMSNTDIAFLIFFIAIFFFLIRHQKKWIKTEIEIPLGIFFVCITISFFYSVNQSVTLHSLVWHGSLIVYFMMLVQMLNTPFRRRFFIYVIFAVVALAGAWAIKDYLYLIGNADELLKSSKAVQYSNSLKYVIQSKRVASLMGWPNVHAALMMFMLPLSIWVVVHVKQLWLKVVCGLCVLSMLISLVFTYSVGVLISFVAAIIVATLCLGVIPKQYRRWVWIVTIFAVMAGAIVIGYRLNTGGVSSIGPRLGYLKSAYHMLAEYPFWGSGWNTFQSANRPFIYEDQHYSAYTHNSYLQILAEAGWISFTAFVFVLFSLMRTLFVNMRRAEGDKRWLYVALLCGLTGGLFHNVLSFTFLAPNIAFFWWTLAALATSFCYAEGHVSATLEARPILEFIGVFIACVGLIFSIRNHEAEKYFVYGMKAHDTDQLKAIEYLNKARQWGPLDGRVSVALSMNYFELAKKEKRTDYWYQARKESEKAVEQMPVVFEPYMMLSRIYWLAGKKEEAIEYQREAFIRAPYRFFKIAPRAPK